MERYLPYKGARNLKIMFYCGCLLSTKYFGQSSDSAWDTSKLLFCGARPWAAPMEASRFGRKSIEDIKRLSCPVGSNEHLANVRPGFERLLQLNSFFGHSGHVRVPGGDNEKFGKVISGICVYLCTVEYDNWRTLGHCRVLFATTPEFLPKAPLRYPFSFDI